MDGFSLLFTCLAAMCFVSGSLISQVSCAIAKVRLWDESEPEYPLFIRRACQRCYDLLETKLTYKGNPFRLDEQVLSYNFSENYGLSLEDLQPPPFALLWLRCCYDAKMCWSKNTIDRNSTTLLTCPPFWDGMQCWDIQNSEERTIGKCPEMFYLRREKSSCPRYSSRYCRAGPVPVNRLDYSTCLPYEFHRAKEDQYLDTKEEETDSSTKDLCCRTERRVSLSYKSYILDTCARCYMYLPPGLTKNTFKYNKDTAQLKDLTTNATYWAEWTNATHPIYKTFVTLTAASKWKSCCQAAINCCSQRKDKPRNISSENNETLSDVRCPHTWDGWQCYSSTPAGTVSFSPCADHIYFKTEKPSCTKYAEKLCLPNGRWFFDERKGKEWTSYRLCGRLDDLRKQLLFHIAMHAVSVASLMPALVIFFIYKRTFVEMFLWQLQVYRISMHKHFFSSLLLNGFFAIAFKCIVMLDELEGRSGETILDANNPGCKLLFMLTKYFRLSNYMWMFCEGFYLHKLIASAFAEQKNLFVYYLIGWGFPLLPVTIYGSLRKAYFDEQCWIIPANNIEWFVNGPSLLSLVMNLFFLCNIIRVLLTKLRATHSNEPSQYRKAVRATIVLIPLFGLHFLFILYRPQSGSCDFLTGYAYFSHTLDGLQGFFVSLTFCYCNGEVVYLLRRSYQRRQMRTSIGRQSFTANNTTHLSLSTQVSMADYTKE